MKNLIVCFGLTVVFLCGYFAVIEAGTPCMQPPVTLRPDACCEFPKRDKEEQVVEECTKQFAAQTARLFADKSPGPKRGCCLAECIFTGLGHANFSGNHMGDEALQEAEAKGMSPEWTPVLKSMKDFCMTEGKKRMDDFEAGFKLPPLDPADKVCHPKYGFALMCSMKEMLANCPAKFFKDTPDCKQLQDFAKTCDM